jgi:hypothetical protein
MAQIGQSTSAILNPFLGQLQRMYGSFDPNKVQTRRRSYYSFAAYPTAGQTTFNFFSSTVGQLDRQLTNIQRSGHFDNPLIVKAIRMRYFITAQSVHLWAGTDVSTIYSDIVNGLFTCGVVRVVIGSKEWLQIPTPFFYAPVGYGAPEVHTAGTQGVNISSAPYAYPSRLRRSSFIVDPSFLIGSDQNFQFSLEYPSGAVPVIGTTVVTGNTTLYVGMDVDGIEIRPVQ